MGSVADLLQTCCKTVAHLLQTCCIATKTERRERVRDRDRYRLTPYIPLTGGNVNRKEDFMKTPTTDRWRYRKSGQHGFSEDTFTGYPALAAAIVRQAVEDYREAERLERGEIHYSSLGIYCPAQTKKEIVRFFRSTWYGTLCDIDADKILRKLGAIK